MISQAHRFHGHGSLNFVYRTGKSVRGEFVSLRFAPARQPDFRMAVVVSKKVSKSAVVRNRIRRRLFEIIRVERLNRVAPMPYDLVLSIFDERVAVLPAEQLRESVLKLLAKAGI